MKKLLSIFIISIVLQGCAINGFKTGNQGKHFHTSVSDKINDTKVEKIAVFVFSNGKIKDGNQPFLFNGLMFLYRPGFGMTGRISSINPDPGDYGIYRGDFPQKITSDIVFNPDTSNSGPSLELALQVVNELKEKGYYAKEILELGHTGEIQYQDIINKTKALGYDAAMIIYYSGFERWTKYVNETEHTSFKRTIVTVNINEFKGYLYLPNAAFVNVSNGDILWSTQHYGLVQKAHYINFSGQDFNEVEMDALIECGDDAYPLSAKKAKDMIFKPKYWPKSFIEFPNIAKKKMKI